MSNQIQETIDKYLRGEMSLEEGLAALQAYMDSSSALSMRVADLSPEQRTRFDALLRRFYEVRKEELNRLISEARKAGREVAEVHFRNGDPGQRTPTGDS